MDSRVLFAEHSQPNPGAETRVSVEMWLRCALAERFAGIVEEPLPDALLQLLPRA